MCVVAARMHLAPWAPGMLARMQCKPPAWTAERDKAQQRGRCGRPRKPLGRATSLCLVRFCVEVFTKH